MQIKRCAYNKQACYNAVGNKITKESTMPFTLNDFNDVNKMQAIQAIC